MGFDFMFGISQIFIPLVFLFVFGAILFTAIRGIGTWHKNNNSPRLTVAASVVAKRTAVSHHTHANGGGANGMYGSHTSSSTHYFATFQMESGDRMELSVSGSEYGMLAEGDRGKLTFQGTRYLSFEREF